MKPTGAHHRFMSAAHADCVTATREIKVRSRQGHLAAPVFACYPEMPGMQGIVAALEREGLVRLVFDVRVGWFEHYRVEPTPEGVALFELYPRIID